MDKLSYTLYPIMDNTEFSKSLNLMLVLHEMLPIQHSVISIKFCLLDQDGPICSEILPWLWPEIL